MKTYAAYGSNMNLEQMSKRCPKAKIIGKGILEDYELNFKGKGHLNIDPFKGGEVQILIWEISSECESELDIYEEFPKYYIKKEINVKTKGKVIKAMAYVMKEEYQQKYKEPTDEYYNITSKGFIDNKMDTKALEKALVKVKSL